VSELQGGARQHVVVVAGPKAMVKESLMRAKVMGSRVSKHERRYIDAIKYTDCTLLHASWGLQT
jgi:hypothetical protein